MHGRPTREEGGKEGRKEKKTHKPISFGSSGALVSDHHGLQDLPKLLEVVPHCVTLGLPSQASNKDLGVSGVSKLTCYVWSHPASPSQSLQVNRG